MPEIERGPGEPPGAYLMRFIDWLYEPVRVDPRNPTKTSLQKAIREMQVRHRSGNDIEWTEPELPLFGEADD